MNFITYVKVNLTCGASRLHRDFQASSILLDDNFEVRLGSLSEVCAAAETDPRETRFARFLRLPKYVSTCYSITFLSLVKLADL